MKANYLKVQIDLTESTEDVDQKVPEETRNQNLNYMTENIRIKGENCFT